MKWESNWRSNWESKWTASENKMFENALAVYDKDTPDRWHKVAAMIPGKSAGDVMKQYTELENDVSDIEAGLIPIPGYMNMRSPFSLELKQWYGHGKRCSSRSPADQERKKGVPWTEEEHKLFLLGLKKYGKGDWRTIARNYVRTRTPTQVASHAQKYFIRQMTGGKDKRRASIHDINLPQNKGVSSDPYGLQMQSYFGMHKHNPHPYPYGSLFTLHSLDADFKL